MKSLKAWPLVKKWSYIIIITVSYHQQSFYGIHPYYILLFQSLQSAWKATEVSKKLALPKCLMDSWIAAVSISRHQVLRKFPRFQPAERRWPDWGQLLSNKIGELLRRLKLKKKQVLKNLTLPLLKASLSSFHIELDKNTVSFRKGIQVRFYPPSHQVQLH